MTTPDPTSENNPASQTLAPVPANSDSRSQKDLSLIIQVSFDRIAAAAAAETVGRVDRAVVTSAPALHLHKAFEKNKMVPGTKLIYMGILDHPRVGRPINLFTAGKDFGIMKADDAMGILSGEKHWEGHAGLPLVGRGYVYEARVFDSWKNGRGMDQWVVMPLVVLAGREFPGEENVFEGNLYDNRREGDLKATLNTSGEPDAGRYLSCTEHRDRPNYVRTVRFSDGLDYWLHRYYWSSVRPCLARELDHLTL